MTARSAKLRLIQGGQPSTADGVHSPLGGGPDDSELLAAMRAGDPSMATVFHDRVRPKVERTISRLLGRRDQDHDDVVQMALMELVVTLDRYRGECSLDSWVSIITARIAYKTIRRRKLERKIFEPSHEVDAESHRAGRARQDIEGKDLLGQVTAHLKDMKPERSWAFVLHDVWGYDLKEVSTIMRVSVSAAQSRLVRGRRELHARIAEDQALRERLDQAALRRKGGSQ